jgi:D,D-heptose 1,7-bisphosphate phosphatase
MVSNQSGVARGYFSEGAVKVVNRKLQSLLKAKGARVDAFFYCPHYPGGKIKPYAKVCDCRKPKAGMVKQALRKYSVDLKRSYVVGDKFDDLLLARNAKVAKGILVKTGYGKKSEKKLKNTPLAKSPVVSDVLKAARFILVEKRNERNHG